MADFAFDEDVRYDPTRIAAQVVTGIGFLGAGAIIQSGITVRGLTTAAGLWVAAGVGMVTAFGYWVAAVGATVLAVGALYGLKIVDRRMVRMIVGKHVYLAITTTDEFDLASLESTVEEHDARLVSFKVRAEGKENRHLSANVQLGDQTRTVDLAARCPGSRGWSTWIPALRTTGVAIRRAVPGRTGWRRRGRSRSRSSRPWRARLRPPPGR